MRKLRDYMHKQGREERQAFMGECSGFDGRLAAVEAQAEHIAGKLERLLRLRGLQANVEGSMVDKMLQEPE